MRQISARGSLPGIFLSRGTLDWLCGQGSEGIAPVSNCRVRLHRRCRHCFSSNTTRRNLPENGFESGIGAGKLYTSR
jgi:hypothetical protein